MDLFEWSQISEQELAIDIFGQDMSLLDTPEIDAGVHGWEDYYSSIVRTLNDQKSLCHILIFSRSPLRVVRMTPKDSLFLEAARNPAKAPHTPTRQMQITPSMTMSPKPDQSVDRATHCKQEGTRM